MDSSQEPGEPRPTAAGAEGADPGAPASGPAAPPAAKRPLTWGQQIASVLFLIVFLIVGIIISWAQMRARHPH
jgi:hypothetical protein